MFSEFLRGQMFTAKFIATPWDKRLAVSARVGDEIPNREIEEARRRDYDNLLIEGDSSQVTGYVRREQVAGRRLEASMIHPFESFTIPSDTPLAELAQRLEKDWREQCALYFVVDVKGPLGLMTYADLNRRTAYIFSYTVLLFIEQWIRK